MLGNRVLRYVVYGASAALLSEVVYRGFLWLRAGLAKSAASAEVSEVVWTNELTQTCSCRRSAQLSRSVVESPSIAAAKSSLSSESNRAPVVCRSRYCAVNNVGRLVELIDKAKYSIDLAMYTFTSFELSQAIGRALKRGLDIRIISDTEMVYSSGSQIIALTSAGIPVRFPSSSNTMLMHHKFCILDGPSRAVSVLAKEGKTYDKKRVTAVLMSGSLNWTMQGFGGNFENILITSNKTFVEKFEDEFQRMWIAFGSTNNP